MCAASFPLSLCGECLNKSHENMALDVFFYPLQKHLYFELMVELV